MKIRYEPCLMEDVLFLEMKRREEAGDLHLFQEYHALADPIYEGFPSGTREVEFEKLHARLFLQWGFGVVLAKALEEHPELEGVEELFVGKAVTRRDEVADLSQDRKRVGIKIRPERFQDPEGLRRYLRHELRHVSDMLDPAFGYCPEGAFTSSQAEANLIKDRYRAIWAISVGGRLQREGKETAASKGERWREFEALYQKIPYVQRLAIFENLWGAGRLTHGEILAMAKDPTALLGRAGEADVSPHLSPLKLPGSPCPLCRFPTYSWVEEFDEAVVELIKGDFPGWEPEERACGRCVEVYAVRREEQWI